MVFGSEKKFGKRSEASSGQVELFDETTLESDKEMAAGSDTQIASYSGFSVEVMKVLFFIPLLSDFFNGLFISL